MGGSINWPILPNDGFLGKRIATEADLNSGDAIFMQQAGPVEPLDIAIPQYAWLTEEDGRERPVVVMQGERSDAGDILGLRDFEGGTYVVTLEEVRLLGTEVPHG